MSASVLFVCELRFIAVLVLDTQFAQTPAWAVLARQQTRLGCLKHCFLGVRLLLLLAEAALPNMGPDTLT